MCILERQPATAARQAASITASSCTCLATACFTSTAMIKIQAAPCACTRGSQQQAGAGRADHGGVLKFNRSAVVIQFSSSSSPLSRSCLRSPWFTPPSSRLRPVLPVPSAVTTSGVAPTTSLPTTQQPQHHCRCAVTWLVAEPG